MAVIFLIGACATAPKDAPPFSMTALPPSSPDYALLVVYRNFIVYKGNKPDISVNGREAVSLPNEAFTWIEVKPGHVKVQSDWTRGADNGSGFVDLDVEAGHNYYIEITDNPPPSPETLPALLLAQKVMHMTIQHDAVEGRGLTVEEEVQATANLKTCCRYVPLDDDFVPLVDDAHP